jgi:signal transduction histidine kinase
MDWLPRLVARVRASIHTKLLVAFLAIAAMMLSSGIVGLRALAEVNHRAEEMVQLQRKIAAYHQLNHDTIGQLYGVASSLLMPDERTLEATLRQLNQFGYDLDRVQYVAQDEKDLLRHARQDYEEFIRIVTREVALIRGGSTSEARALQINVATPLADQLERLTNELVNKAESDMVASVEASHAAYAGSRRAVMAFAAASVVLALALGYTISASIVHPVRQMEAHTREIAAGDFGRRVEVSNRDELGVLAADLNRMSEELGRLYAQLEAASRHKSEFLANMSHELRTPLNAIIGFSEVLKDGLFGALNAKQAEYLLDIHASGHHLLSLINDILDLSKIEAGRMELAVAKFDLPSTLGNAMAFVRERAQWNGIVLELAVDARLNSFSGDERRVKQILLNLLSNAVKFTPAGGTVRVVAAPTGTGVEISVRDTGIGIPPDRQHLLFQAFQQLDSEDGVKREGTGLGLALVRRLAELHGGHVSVESAPGTGSTFSVTLSEQSCETL